MQEEQLPLRYINLFNNYWSSAHLPLILEAGEAHLAARPETPHGNKRQRQWQANNIHQIRKLLVVESHVNRR
jgi:hypothetical protein